jgi:transcriptional regulator with XRE-family HTH domain
MALKPPAGWTPPDPNIRRGRSMREMRVKHGITQKAIGAYLKIAPSEVAALEAGRRAWDNALLSAWIDACRDLRRV